MELVKRTVTLTLFLSVISGCTDFSSKPANAPSSQAMAEIEYGRKLVLIMGCNDCHTSGAISGVYGPEEDWLIGDTLGYKGPYGTQYPSNLRLLVSEITEDEWVVLAQKMRQNSPMAWSRLPSLDREGLRAIYRFIDYLGPKGDPAPSSLPPGVEPKTNFFYFPLPH